VFVVDTGIYVENADFGGRATFFWKAESSWSNTDANGHGTHVASTAAGSFYGVAPLANLYAVKVLGDDGSGTNAGVIAGVDRVTAAHSSGQSKRTVANLSLGGGYSSALNDACDEAVDAGVVMVVAAGNEDDDACYSSPASAAKVISVGSTDVGVQGFNEQIDERSSFSNYGECVDIFAPGSDITAAWIGSTTATATISGTSMASPHVAGVAALVLSTNPSYSSTEVRDYILNNAIPNKISLRCANNEESCRYSPNLLLNNGCNV
jgi:subtilisin family serine protease